MADSESLPDEPYETVTRQLSMPENYPIDTGYQPRSSEHAQSSTHTTYPHHHQTHSGASFNANNTKKQHPSSISDNFNALKKGYRCVKGGWPGIIQFNSWHRFYKEQ